MNTKLLITTATLTGLYLTAAGSALAEGDQVRNAINNPNETLPPVQNQNVTTTSPSPTTAAGYQYQYQQQDGVETKTQNQGEDTQVRAEAGRSDVAGKHAYRLQFRFENYTQKLSEIADRIQRVINRYARQGKNMTPAQNKLNQAGEQLNQAQTQANNAVAAFSSIDPNMYQYQRQIAVGASEMAEAARSAYQYALGLMLESVRLARQAE